MTNCNKCDDKGFYPAPNGEDDSELVECGCAEELSVCCHARVLADYNLCTDCQEYVEPEKKPILQLSYELAEILRKPASDFIW